MTDDSIGSPVDRYASVNKLIMSTYNITCLVISYKHLVDVMRETGWDKSAAVGGML